MIMITIPIVMYSRLEFEAVDTLVVDTTVVGVAVVTVETATEPPDEIVERTVVDTVDT